MSATDLAGMISASAPLDTVLITLTVTDTDPQRAADIANAVADQFAVTVSDLELSGIGIDSPVKVSTVEEAIAAGANSVRIIDGTDETSFAAALDGNGGTLVYA